MDDQVLSRLLAEDDIEQRAALLVEICGDDVAMRRRMLDSLAEHERSLSPTVFPSKPDIADDTRPTLAAPRTLVGQSLGNFKILEQLGEGGMGVVYLAQQDQPIKRCVAIKVTKSSLMGETVIARFQAERQALALMDHENIARVFDAGETEDGRLYFVMELVGGLPITEYCDQRRLSTDDRLRLFVSVCRAIQHAHQKGIIHRDVKPSNVLVTDADGKPLAKVIDFGLAKAMQQQLTPQTLHTQFGQVLGTLEYMSPEQARFTALDVDTRTDVYALGVLLYELLTGTTPLGRQRVSRLALDEVLEVIREEEPSRPSARLSEYGGDAADISAQRASDTHHLREKFRGDLDAIVLKALAKDRNRRYDSAAALASDIQRHLNNEPIEARPPSARYLIGKFARRHRALVMGATGVVVALAMGIGFSTFFALRASRQSKVAIENSKRAMTAEREANEAADRAAHQATLAQKQSDLAMQTLSNVVHQIQRPLAEIPAAREVRQQMLEMAITGLKRVADNMDQRTDTDRNLMIALEDLGDVFFNLGSTKDATEVDNREFALRQYQHAMDIANRRLAEDPNDHTRKYDLQVCYQRIGSFLQTTGQLTESVEKTRRAATIAAELSQNDPVLYTGSFWNLCFALSGLYFRNDDVESAILWTQKAKELADRVERDGMKLRQPLSDPLVEEIELRCQAFPLIEQVYEDVDVAFSQPAPVMQRLLSDRALYFLKQGDPIESLNTVDLLLKQDDLAPSAYYSAACRYSGCAGYVRGDAEIDELTEEDRAAFVSYRDESMRLLRVAIDHGQFDGEWIALAYLNRDHDLDPIRDQTEFQQLLQEVKERDWPESTP